MWPSRKQWRTWSLPSRLTLIGTYATILGLAVAVAPMVVNYFWPSTANSRAALNFFLPRNGQPATPRGAATPSLDIRVGNFVDDIKLDVREGYGMTPGPITFAFPVTFLNLGERPALVAGYDLFPLGCAYEYPIRSQDGDQGFFSNPNGSEPVVFPIVIAAGEGRTLYLKTGIVLTPEAYLSAEKLGKRATLRDLIMNVLPHDFGGEPGVGQDLFGNRITYGVGNRGLFDYDLVDPPTVNQPTYKLVVHTEPKSDVAAVFAPYPEGKRASPSSDCPEEPFSKRPTLQLHEPDT